LFAVALSASSLLHGQSVVYTGASPLNFGSVNVCPPGATTPSPCSQTLTLTYNIAADTTIGRIDFLTTGAPLLDFQAKAGGTNTTLCAAQRYSSAAICTVDVTFAPLHPGQRIGAVEFLDENNNVLAATHLDGTGVGPQIAFSPSPQTTVGSGFSSPQGVAVDAAGTSSSPIPETTR
jgi:hypothetical protein